MTYVPETEAQWRARMTKHLRDIVTPLLLEYRAGTAMDYGFDILRPLDELKRSGVQLKAELKRRGWDIDAPEVE